MNDMTTARSSGMFFSNTLTANNSINSNSITVITNYISSHVILSYFYN